MVSSSRRVELGRLGEQMACEHLESRGYRILEKNFRTVEGEIDLIACKDGTTVFVEVKTRSGRAFGTPEESVTASKARTIRRVASAYLARRSPGEVRFDVIGIEFGGGPQPELRHTENAF